MRNEPIEFSRESELCDMVASIIELHERIRPGLYVDEARVEPCVSSTFFSSFGSMPFRTLTEQVANLAHKLAKDHPFLDGNKRTAVMAPLSVLETYGYMTLDVDSDAIYTMIQRLSRSEMSRDELATWLSEHARDLDD